VQPVAALDEKPGPAQTPEQLRVGIDGLPALTVGRPVTNAEVLDAIDQERAER
jgi:hypothetical protein